MMKQIRDFTLTKNIALAQTIAVGNHSYLSTTSIQELESLGVSLQNHTNNKVNATDMFMVNTIHSYCHAHKPPYTIVVIASNGDLCKMLTWLESSFY
jgi:erythromycin esterase-like protein